MSSKRRLRSYPVLVEIEHSVLRMQTESGYYEEVLGRGPEGLLTDTTIDRLKSRLRSAIGQGPLAALCALGARGVSLRRFSLPGSSRENPGRMLALQIESEFPIPPRELAWAYTPISAPARDAATIGSSRDYLVAAVKRNVVEQYDALLREVGLEPVFTLGAMMLSGVVPENLRDGALLSVGSKETEWILLEGGLPVAVRTIPWGEDSLLDPLAASLEVDRDRVKRWLAEEANLGAGEDSEHPLIVQAVRQSLEMAWTPGINGESGRRIGVAAREKLAPGVTEAVSMMAGPAAICENLGGLAVQSGSPVMEVLRRQSHRENYRPSIILRCETVDPVPSRTVAGSLGKWVMLAVLLLLALISIRYIEPFVQRDRVAQDVAAMRAIWEGRPEIDHELAFLQYFQTNQPPFLELLGILAEAAGRGTKFDSVTLNRRGEMSLKGVMPDSKVAGSFRSKLIGSGWFTSIVLEEQSPVANNRKVNVRLSGRWRPSSLAPGESAPAEEEMPSEEDSDEDERSPSL